MKTISDRSIWASSNIRLSHLLPQILSLSHSLSFSNGNKKEDLVFSSYFSIFCFSSSSSADLPHSSSPSAPVVPLRYFSLLLTHSSDQLSLITFALHSLTSQTCETEKERREKERERGRKKEDRKERKKRERMNTTCQLIPSSLSCIFVSPTSSSSSSSSSNEFQHPFISENSSASKNN